MIEAALSTSATNPTIAIQRQQPMNVSQVTIWKELEENGRVQLTKYWAELIRQVRESQTIDEGGLDELP
jgi:hypothetical protein